MIGPSSSHTAGAVRIGRIAWKILGEDAVRADITLFGSFAHTYKGHGTDKALIAGILGMRPDDERIPMSFEIAKERALEYKFLIGNNATLHPNTAGLMLYGKHGAECLVEGVSVGGCSIRITKLNGLEAAFTGNADTLIIAHHDVPGVVASITSHLANLDINIGSMRMTRPRKNEMTILTLEIDSGIERAAVNDLRSLKDITSVVYLRHSL